MIYRWSAIICCFLLFPLIGQNKSETSINEAAAHAPESDQEWTTLFNGKDLEGWTMKIKGQHRGGKFRQYL